MCIHNNVIEMKPTGETYTDEEFKALDPMRAKVCEQLSGADLPHNLVMGCKEKWTRGEDIHTDNECVIQYRGQPWLVVRNQGGGACTTRFLKNQFAKMGWFGTDPKPAGWIDAQVIAQGTTEELRKKLFPNEPEKSITESLEEIVNGGELGGGGGFLK